MQNWRGIVYEHSSSLFRDLPSPFLSSILFLYLLSIVLSFSSIFFLRFSHLYFSFSLSHAHTRVPLTDEVQRTRERGACAGLHDCRNCRYAAKVEGVQRQPCARLLSVFLSVFFPPPFSFFFLSLSTPSSSPFFSDRHSRYSIFFLSMSFARIFRPCINLQKEHGDSILLPWLQHFVALQMFVLNVTLKFERKRKENYLR